MRKKIAFYRGYGQGYGLAAAAICLYLKSSLPEASGEALDEAEQEEPDFSRIRCPHCKWQPDRSSLWCCADCAYPEFFFDGCWTEWNTFATRGLCPGCSHQWRWTACLVCEGWSLHEDWYLEQRT